VSERYSAPVFIPGYANGGTNIAAIFVGSLLMGLQPISLLILTSMLILILPNPVSHNKRTKEDCCDE
jgi:hypothetical protein